MALTDPRIFFGVHSVSPYSRTTGEFFGIAKVLAGSSLALNGELVQLNGGSNKWPWAIEDGLLNAEVSLALKEYPDFVFELFLGKAVTNNAADALGDVSTLTNNKGTSAVDATTGMASIAALAASEADLKFGKYVIKAVTATTIDVFFSSDLDIDRGTDGEYQNDVLKVTVSALTVPGTGGTVSIPNFGLEITGGSGSIAFVTGDTATFEVRPINTLGSTEVTIGATNDFRPEFGMIVMGAKRSSGEMVEFDLFRCKGIGLPVGFEENTFSEAEVTIQAFYDAALNAVFKMRLVKP